MDILEVLGSKLSKLSAPQSYLTVSPVATRMRGKSMHLCQTETATTINLQWPDRSQHLCWLPASDSSRLHRHRDIFSLLPSINLQPSVEACSTVKAQGMK